MNFVRNILRCLFRGIRRSRRRILVSVLIIVTLWHLHLFNSGHINRIQVVREPATRLDVNLRFNSLRERIFGNDPKNHQGERIIISEGTEKHLKNHNHTPDKSVGLHSSLQSLKLGDTQNYSGKEKSFSDLHSQRNSSSTCREFSLTDANKNSYGTCQPHKASLDACDFADVLYRYDSSLSVCKINKENAEICSLASDVHQERTMLKAKCNGQVCEGLVNKSEKKFVTYGVYSIDPDEGVLESIRDFETVSELETQLPRIALLTSRNKFNFLFVKCFSISSNETLVSQLVQVPPLATIQGAVKPPPKNNININIVLLDSVSRPHFYRSLPKTIETFRKLSKRRDIAPARVFDFELFQAVHGHTTQNEHALFTGKLLPSADEEDEPSEPVRADVLFGHFKRAGYQTMWQEDLCWTGVWGPMTDLNAEDWEELQIKLRENFIDNTGKHH